MKLIKFLGFLSGSILSVLIFAVTMALIYRYTTLAFNSTKSYYDREDIPEMNITVVVDEGAGVSDVARELRRKGLIENELLFQLDTYLSGDSDIKFLAGEYTLRANMDADEIRDSLEMPANMENTDISVMISEGLTIKEIGSILETNGITTQEGFISACATEKFNYGFLNELGVRENYLEGYLFPDTYFFTKNMEPRLIIDKMLNQFNEIYSDEYIVRTNELNLTTDDIIKIASILEKETRQVSERPIISSIIHNRLNSGMKLQLPSTILHVVEKERALLEDSDFSIDSPYNTFLYGGLPSAPISNPGKDCIEAALHPSNTDYLYFLLKDEETGEHFFTNSPDEFENAKIDFNQRF
ncbi:MAG: endolytic transglycosylase MltG [Clostridiales bacterium]|nr:endolytic transglycosylase MltG [Clostridiales bacterium]